MEKVRILMLVFSLLFIGSVCVSADNNTLKCADQTGSHSISLSSVYATIIKQ